jgi:hypothetical protein
LSEEAIRVQPVAFVTIKLFAALSGYSEKACWRKIEDGVWLDGQEYVRAPDGRVLMCIPGYERWVRTDRHHATVAAGCIAPVAQSNAARMNRSR